jgi:type IV secretion system protein VirB10
MSPETESLDPPPRLAVARPSGGLPTPIVLAAFAMLAIVLFLVLDARRDRAEARSLTTPTPDAAASEPAPPLQLPEPPPEPEPAPAALSAPAPPAAPPPSETAETEDDDRARRAAPAVVVDLGGQGRPLMLAQASVTPRPATGGGSAPEPSLAQLLENPGAKTGVEALSQRLQIGGRTPGAAVATQMGDLSLTVPQGAVIPAVLETAIDSDLPGYTRAVVSRDVRSFDGALVLIPRGSRLIGQYRSATSLGQKRAFVIWSRVIRPDGVSVEIGSPGTDDLGRGGLTGKVDRHFFTRFGGSILLSVLNAGIAAVGDGPMTTIAIGSPGQAAAAASMVQPENIPPTIKVAQGQSIRIFVARDLDFSAVGPAP